MYMLEQRIAPARTVSLIASAVALALALAQSAAAAPDTSGWKCEKCPFESGYRADYTVGGSYVSDDAVRFGDANGYDEKGGYVMADGAGSYVSDGYRMRWTLEDLGLDSRFAEVEGGHQGSYEYRLAYRQLPHHVFDTSDTVFSQTAKDTLSLPAGWVRAGTTDGFTALDASLFGKNIESERKTLEAGARFLPGTRFELFANYRRQERDGVDVLGGSFYTNSSLLPRPFDYQTDEVDAGIAYRGESGYLKLAYYGSFFQDQATALIWANPFTGPDRGALAQAPDNNFQQVQLSGSYQAPYNTVVAVSGALGRMEQDDDFLGYTINPALAAGALPRATLDGEVDTTNLALTFVSRPISIARIKLAYRYDERDNKTPVETWERVLVDTLVSNETATNTPYGFERTRFNASADVDVLKGLRLSAGYDRTELDRDYQEVAEQTEDEAWGRVRWRPNGYIDVNLRGGSSKRDIDRYDETISADLDQNPLMRKYHLAYRERDFAELMISASLPEAPLSFTGSVFYASDDYAKSKLGLLESDDRRYAADLSWAVSDKASIYLSGGFEDIDAKQAGSELFAAPDWRATNADEFYTAGGGFRVRDVAGRFDFELDYTHAEGTSEIEVSPLGSSASRFPDLESTLDAVRLRAIYRWSEQLEAILQVRYESFTAEDWSLEGVESATLPLVLTLGADPYDYDVTVVGLGFRYYFGGRNVSLPEE